MSLRRLAAPFWSAVLVASAVASMAAEPQYPDWSGQWALMGPYVWDPSKPKDLGQQAPLTPEYQAVFEASLADQAAGGPGNDFHIFCRPFGMPRIMGTPWPMEFVVTPKAVFILFENAMPRRIYTDGRGWPKEIEPSFNGYSIGKWVDSRGQGRYDRFEVETRGLKGPRAFEANGLPLHSDNQSVFKEVIYRDSSDPQIMHDEITKIDHALTRPWTVDKRYHRAKERPWFDDDCNEANPFVRIGQETYFVGADGALMPSKKNQAPPDLRYFKRDQ